MKITALLVALAAALPSGAGAATLEIRVEGLPKAEGQLLLALADSAAGWDGQAEPRARRRQAVTGTTEIVRIDDLAPGAYAISVFHDANANGRMDKNIVGMPTEGYGFSRNPVVMRKATFEEARFELAADGGAVVIELR